MDNEERNKVYAEFIQYFGSTTIWYIQDNVMEFTAKLDACLDTLANDPRIELEF